jgi:nitroreductase
MVKQLLLSVVLLNVMTQGSSVNNRKTGYPVNQLIIDRWSSRAMSGEPISDEQLMTLFEAARWTPSSYNDQPWHFIYAKRDTSAWQTFFDLLVPFNQSWVKNAAVLIVIISRNTFAHNGELSCTHSFDTGAAWQNLTLQGSFMGLVIHGMGGFDYDKAKKALAIPDGYTVEAMVAVGKPGPVSVLPENLQAKEGQQSGRNELSSFVFEGTFTK